jgi:protein TonB
MAPQREAPAPSEASPDREAGPAPSAASNSGGSTAAAPATLAVVTGPSRATASPPASAVLVPAAYLHTPEPAYPASAREEGEEGVVLLRVRISPRGLPEEIVLDRSSGSRELDSAAIAGVKRWSFTPARRGDEAIEAWMQVPIRFRLG